MKLAIASGFLLGMLHGATVPVASEPIHSSEGPLRPRSHAAMGCMMLRECVDGVREVKDWGDFGPGYLQFKDELNDILKYANASGIRVFLAPDKYFYMMTRGLYSVQGNNFFLNERYLDNPTMMVKVVRHEGWHAVQDCMAGTLDNTFTAVVWQDGFVPDWIQRGAEKTYPPSAVPYEAEAMYAAFSDTHTREGLQACASDTPMWEVYKPTPLTAKWLKEQKFMF